MSDDEEEFSDQVINSLLIAAHDLGRTEETRETIMTQLREEYERLRVEYTIRQRMADRVAETYTRPQWAFPFPGIEGQLTTRNFVPPEVFNIPREAPVEFLPDSALEPIVAERERERREYDRVFRTVFNNDASRIRRSTYPTPSVSREERRNNAEENLQAAIEAGSFGPDEILIPTASYNNRLLDIKKESCRDPEGKRDHRMCWEEDHTEVYASECTFNEYGIPQESIPLLDRKR